MIRRPCNEMHLVLSQSTPALPSGAAVTEYERAYWARHAPGIDRPGGVQSEPQSNRFTTLESKIIHSFDRPKDVRNGGSKAPRWNSTTQTSQRTPRIKKPYIPGPSSREPHATDETFCQQWEAWAADVARSAHEHAEQGPTAFPAPPELPSNVSRVSAATLRMKRVLTSVWSVVLSEGERLHLAIQELKQDREGLVHALHAAEEANLQQEKLREFDSDGRQKGGGSKSPSRRQPKGGAGKSGRARSPPRSPKRAGDSQPWYRTEQYVDPDKRLSLFSWLDQNGDDKISREEFLIAMRTGVISSASARSASEKRRGAGRAAGRASDRAADSRKSLFSTIDLAHSDQISRQQFTDAMAAGLITTGDADQTEDLDDKAEKLEDEVKELVRALGVQ
mmetsp:Transcript_137935/g.238327  ORF Transcript_137935/g.238327 Transcript_137935/m.238327 type:complete len:392 (+) Transcript_137935:63-1238(+)